MKTNSKKKNKKEREKDDLLKKKKNIDIKAQKLNDLDKRLACKINCCVLHFY